MVTEKTLAIVGAGPKAIAIAAKARVLSDLGWCIPELLVIEKDRVAAHWLGGCGYTDGEQLLGTPPFKDVGFPYDSNCWGDDNKKVNLAMTSLSWQSYLIENRKFANWVDRGRPAPSHRWWGEYLQWVADTIGLQPKSGTLRCIDLSEQRWKLEVEWAEGIVDTNPLECSGLVITGPGDAIPPLGVEESHPRVLDGRSFWNNLNDFRGRQLGVAVVGSGETAASVATTLHKILDKNSQIEIINTEGALYSRGESFDENRRFTQPGDWQTLTEPHRREFVKRTDRGVFSLQAKAVLDQAENIQPRKGRVLNLTPLELKVKTKIQYDQEIEQNVYDYVIWATGFDSCWFRGVLSPTAREKVHNEVGGWENTDMERRIGRDLSIERLLPKLHLPMYASLRQGPGFPNLSCLGRLSDRILATYATPPMTPNHANSPSEI